MKTKESENLSAISSVMRRVARHIASGSECGKKFGGKYTARVEYTRDGNYFVNVYATCVAHRTQEHGMTAGVAKHNGKVRWACAGSHTLQEAFYEAMYSCIGRCEPMKYGVRAYGTTDFFNSEAAFRRNLVAWRNGTDGHERSRAERALLNLNDGVNFTDTDNY